MQLIVNKNTDTRLLHKRSKKRITVFRYEIHQVTLCRHISNNKQTVHVLVRYIKSITTNKTTGQKSRQTMCNFQNIQISRNNVCDVPEPKRCTTISNICECQKRGLVRLKQARSTNGMMNHIASMVNNM